MGTARILPGRNGWLAAVCLLGLLSGCGSGATDGPDGNDGGAAPRGGDSKGGGSNGGGGDGGDGEVYRFRLPIGDDSTDPTSTAYLAIAAGRCGQAEETLRTLGTLDQLFQIGLDLCRGNVSAARSKLAGYRYDGGGEGWQRCELYRVSASVIHQRPKSSFAQCPPIPRTQTPPTDPPDGGEAPEPERSPSPPAEPGDGAAG